MSVIVSCPHAPSSALSHQSSSAQSTETPCVALLVARPAVPHPSGFALEWPQMPSQCGGGDAADTKAQPAQPAPSRLRERTDAAHRRPNQPPQPFEHQLPRASRPCCPSWMVAPPCALVSLLLVGTLLSTPLLVLRLCLGLPGRCPCIRVGRRGRRLSRASRPPPCIRIPRRRRLGCRTCRVQQSQR